MNRILALTERAPRVVRLRRGDAEFLLAHHRGRIEVVPTPDRGRYRLTALGVAGVLPCPHVRLAIRPKLPPGDLLRLLDPLAPDDLSTPVETDSLLDVLARRFAVRLRELVANGLHRGYVEKRAAGPTLIGRLDVAEQVGTFRRDVLHSRYDELTTDIDINRHLHAIVQTVLAQSDISDATRGEFEALRPHFCNIAAARSSHFVKPPGYGPVLAVASLLDRGLAPGPGSGFEPGPAFLLDLQRAFELAVTMRLEAAFAERPTFRVCAQPWLNVVASGSPMHVRPDIVIERRGQMVAVVDAKWKRPIATGAIGDDVYQVLGYTAALGLRRAALVYPGRRIRRVSYELTGGIALDVWSTRPGGSLSRLAATIE
ncbi:MAG: hypothetical protein U0746_04500 [Gemmataceae bacterium]